MSLTSNHPDNSKPNQLESDKAKDLALDVDFETARALHRVVRAMNDGECPKCHFLFRADTFRGNPNGTFHPHPGELVCPHCEFTITPLELNRAIATFAPVMERNLAIFEEWRKTIVDHGQGHGFDVAVAIEAHDDTTQEPQ